MVDHYNIFTPSSPPTVASLLVGREEVRQNIHAYLRSPGAHPVVVGHRGVGKTSLVRSLETPLFFPIEANTVESFDEFAHAVCSEFEINTRTAPETGGNIRHWEDDGDVLLQGSAEVPHKQSSHHVGMGDGEISPYHFRRLLQSRKDTITVAVDEIDAVAPRSDIKGKLVAFIKSIANRPRFPHKFIFMGVGSDIDSLLGKHLSAYRSLKQVYLSPLKPIDIYNFLCLAEEQLEVEMPDSIKKAIAQDSLGFPYYAHEVGFHIMEEYIRRGEPGRVLAAHYEKAKEQAANAAFSHLLKRYKHSIYRLGEIEKEILRAALEVKRALKKQDIDRRVRSLIGRSVDLEDAWATLQRQGYLWVRAADGKVSFQEPLAKPFFRIKIGAQNLDGKQIFLDF